MYVSFIRGAGAGGPPSRLKDVTASAAQITVCTPPGRKVTVTGRLGDCDWDRDRDSVEEVDDQLGPAIVGLYSWHLEKQ